MEKIRKVLLTIGELFFFSSVMFFLFYMVACLSRLFLYPGKIPTAVPLEGEFVVESAEGNQAVVTLPANFNVPDTESLTAITILPERIPEGAYLGYYCSFQAAQLYIDGELRDVSDDNESYYVTDIPANHLEFVRLHETDSGKELRLIYTSPLRGYKGFVGRMAIGEKISIARYMFIHRLPVVILGMGVLFFGLVLLGVGLSREAHVHINRSYKLLGYAGMFIGGWFILQSCICQVFFTDVAWMHWMELICLSLLPLPLLYYMDECSHGLYWQMIQPVCLTSLSFTIIELLLTLGGYDAMRFILLIHLFLVLAVFFAVWILVDLYRSRRDLFRNLYWVVGGFMGFFISILVEVAQFYFFPESEDGFVLSIGTVIFFACNYIWLQNQRVFYMSQEQSEKMKARTKNLFLANMSHEIRTPVNTILITNAMIGRTSDDARIRELASEATVESKKLLSLINDILDYSKISSKHMVIEHSNYDMVWFLRDVYRLGEKYHEDAKQVGMQFHCNPNLPSYLNGDEAKIRRVLENVLENTFANVDHGTVTIRVDYRPLTDEKVLLLIAVEDDAGGIPLEKQQEIMDIFNNRAPMQDDEINANLVDELLRMMDGEMELLSDEGVGTTLTLRIPQTLVDETPIGEKNAKSVEHAILLSSNITYHILLVDDEEMNHRVFKEMLRGENVDITEAYSGEEAVEAVEKDSFDIIFMDHQMPGMNGEETRAKLEELWQGESLVPPCIMMTAANMDAGELKKSGFDGYLAKPMDRQSLLLILKKYEEGGRG